MLKRLGVFQVSKGFKDEGEGTTLTPFQIDHHHETKKGLPTISPHQTTDPSVHPVAAGKNESDTLALPVRPVLGLARWPVVQS